MNNINTFIYYGAEMNKNDYENQTMKFDVTDIYPKIFSKGLRFREIGEISTSWRYMVGKEIYWSTDNMIEFNQDLKINNEDMLLSEDEKIEVRKKLMELGITTPPTYKIFNCW